MGGSVGAAEVGPRLDFGDDGGHVLGLAPALDHVDHDGQRVLVHPAPQEAADLVGILQGLIRLLVLAAQGTAPHCLHIVYVIHYLNYINAPTLCHQKKMPLTQSSPPGSWSSQGRQGLPMGRLIFIAFRLKLALECDSDILSSSRLAMLDNKTSRLPLLFLHPCPSQSQQKGVSSVLGCPGCGKEPFLPISSSLFLRWELGMRVLRWGASDLPLLIFSQQFSILLSICLALSLRRSSSSTSLTSSLFLRLKLQMIFLWQLSICFRSWWLRNSN